MVGAGDAVYSVPDFVVALASVCFCLASKEGGGGCRSIIAGEWEPAGADSVRGLIGKFICALAGIMTASGQGVCRGSKSA